MGSPKGERHFEWANNNSQSVSQSATIPTIKCMMQLNNTTTSEIEILQRHLRLLHKEEEPKRRRRFWNRSGEEVNGVHVALANRTSRETVSHSSKNTAC